VSRCRECSGRRLAFRSARAAVGYDRSAAALVAAWKERGIRVLAPIAADLVAELLPAPAADALTFVPPDGERRLKRGHHPAERLAVELARRWGVPVRPALARTGSLPPQRGLTRAERRRNVVGAFRPSGPPLPPRVILVDDVYTTGGTASSAASALRAGGARNVSVVTFARTVRTSS
jgi:predicted amidophosphoribosyltransferase